MSWHEQLAQDEIMSFPILQMLSSVILDSTGRLSVMTDNKRKHRQDLFEINGDSTHFEVTIKVSPQQPDLRRWLTYSFLRSGMLAPEWNAGMQAIKQYDDVIIGVDTNILFNCIITEHLLDAISGKQSDSYSQKPNWILVAIPSTALLEVENSANAKHCGHLTHAGRMGFRALQELFHLQRNASYTGLSVVIVGEKGQQAVNPASFVRNAAGTHNGDCRDERKGGSLDGHVERIPHGDFLIRKDFKRFLDRIDFYKGIFFATSDKTNAMLAETEGIGTLYARNPATVREGQVLRCADRRCILLARILYEAAVEFGRIELCWHDEKYGAQCFHLDGSWLWKDMANWVRWDTKVGIMPEMVAKVLDSYPQWSIPSDLLEMEWSDIVDGYMV